MIVFVHLLNDRSGSPRILQQAISTLSRRGDGSRLFVGSGGSGFLDDSNVRITRYWYRRTSYRLLTLVTYLTSQICLLLSLLRSRGIDTNAVFYINTLLPFGAALYGWFSRRPVIYHLHEVSISPSPLRWFLVTIARMTAQRLIYVSDYHRKCLPIPGVPFSVVHNSLDQNFLDGAAGNEYRHRRASNFTVLMLASLRDYKGVPEIVALAARLSSRTDIHFDLVANEDDAAIQRYFELSALPSNLTVYPRTNDPATHYAKAGLVLNLSRPDQWVETFGLTLLEAMAFGVPVIAPPVGGPLELVDNGCEGFLIDSRNGDKLADAVLTLADDEALCLRMSAAARRRASRFSPADFAEELREVLAFQHV